jgi:hypothetical protein
MTEHDSPGTEAAPTAAAEPLTTELPPATHAAPELAWSSDDDTAEVEPTHHRGSPLVWSALFALVAVIAGALIFLGATYFGSKDSKPVASQPTSSTVPVAAPPPAPSTVTVTAQAPPPAPSAAPTSTAAPLSDTDEAFLAQMRSGGMSIPTLDAAEYTVTNAHQVCGYRANHDEATTAKYAASITAWAIGANPNVFTEMAEFHYCGQYLPAGY